MSDFVPPENTSGNKPPASLLRRFGRGIANSLIVAVLGFALLAATIGSLSFVAAPLDQLDDSTRELINTFYESYVVGVCFAAIASFLSAFSGFSVTSSLKALGNSQRVKRYTSAILLMCIGSLLTYGVLKSTPRTREAQRAKRESDEIRNDIEVPSDTEVLPKASGANPVRWTYLH